MLEGQASLCWKRSVADWWGCNLCPENWGAVSEKESIATPHKYSSQQIFKNSSWIAYSSISYKKFNSIIILCNHRPSLLHSQKHSHAAHDCTWIFKRTLFIIAKSWEQPKCPSTGKWISKLLYMYVLEYYSAIKKKKYYWYI